MSLFNCNACGDTIPLLKPRIQCRICYSQNLCANCYVLSIYIGTHREDHTTALHEKSGTVPKPPPLPPRRISTPTPPSVIQPPSHVQPQGVPRYPPAQSHPQSGPPPANIPQSQRASIYLPAQSQNPTDPPPPTINAQQQRASVYLPVQSQAPLGPPPVSNVQQKRASVYSPVQPQQPLGPPPSTGIYPQETPRYPSPQPPSNPPPSKIQMQSTPQFAPVRSQPPSGSPPANTQFQIASHSPAPSLSLSNPPPASSHITGTPTPTISPAQSLPPTGHAPSQIPSKPAFSPSYSPAPQNTPTGPAPSTLQVEQGWKPLFNGCNASATGAAFLNSVFSCLDTMKAGMLAPEQYSAFLDVLGYRPEEDVWKQANKPTFGHISEDLADYELRTMYENWTIEHILRPRAAPPNNDMGNVLSSLSGVMGKEFTTDLAPNFAIPRMSGGMMPMITRKGFIDLTTIEFLGEPARSPLLIDRIVRYYQLEGPWSQWGDCPRHMLPDDVPRELSERIERVSAFAKRQAAERIEAARVASAIKAQGQQNVIDLLDPPGTRYIYHRY